MGFTEKIINGVAVITLKGKLMGGEDTNEVHEKVKHLISESTKNVVIDLSKIKWLNSQGLGMLMACLTSVKNAGGDLKISGATERVKSILMVTRLITIFKNFETVDEAVNSLR